ncbi:MAG: 2-oxo acid dehydrogenase subunit E2 [Fidelibacterota bacterium]|nr:MAG: 2-oxo acid dehydrogenase subunit E2 [Candidatus Neomarinimicrobiota bacterium]
MGRRNYTHKPFSRGRRLMTDMLDAASRRHKVHGIIEVDVTRPRQRIQEIREQTGESLSFTGFIIYCCARAVEADKDVHAYRDWRNRLIIFEEVDIATMVERTSEGKRGVIFSVIRAANRKSIQEIHQEIRQAQAKRVAEAQASQWIGMAPSFLRRLFLRALVRAPHRMKKMSGTVLVTSVGMFGDGAGWGIPLEGHTLTITVGGIVNRPCLNNGRLEDREHLCLTVSFDHDIIDGAPAARFIHQFKELVENGSGLFEP